MSNVLYKQIADKIMTDIIKNGYRSGDKYKSVREIAMELKVNPKTVQRAFDYLSNLGIFVTVVGEGRYISNEENIINQIETLLVDDYIEKFINKMSTLKVEKSYLLSQIENKYE